MSNLLADYDPRIEISDGENLVPLTRELQPGEEALFSFQCPNCRKYRICVGVTVEGLPVNGIIRWKVAGVMPTISLHPSIWSKHGHHEGEYIPGQQMPTYHPCEWHRCIFKGRFIDELHAWPVDDPANAKFG